MRNVLIRYWSEKDFSAVRKILLGTWLNTYTFIPEEDIRFHLEKFYTIEKLQQLYTDSNTNCFMAEVNENPIGWMKLYNNENQKRFYVSSLYVLPDYQGFGIGRKFLEVAESLTGKMNYDRIWLGVMKDNIKALNCYKKIGFYFIEEEPFQMGKTIVIHLIGYKLI
ncbi:MAG: GNAT family N-acetyltransferase [Ignavibacterium sp.]|uniref:GNAT family N-acetyltransferase n=1 Tax=Ignavibacterium sp. TaxID=2651167 RepID=UPI00404B6412